MNCLKKNCQPKTSNSKLFRLKRPSTNILKCFFELSINIWISKELCFFFAVEFRLKSLNSRTYCSQHVLFRQKMIVHSILFILFATDALCEGVIKIKIMQVAYIDDSNKGAKDIPEREGDRMFETHYTDLTLCLTNYKNKMECPSRCVYGTETTLMHTNHNVSTEIFMPFSFRWMGNLSVIAIFTKPIEKKFYISLCSHKEKRISAFMASTHAISIEFADPIEDIYHIWSIEINLKCSDNYFGTECSTFCRPSYSVTGHWTCDENVKKLCFTGWKGDYCDKRVRRN